MITSDALDKIAPALVKAQGELPPALKDSKNPHFKSKYADLTSVWAAVGPVLKKHELVALQDGTTTETAVGVRTRIMHSSGQWIEFDPVVIPLTKRDAHGVGSAWTYGRRYGLSAALGVVADDDDGAGAVGLSQNGGSGDAQDNTDPTRIKNAPGVSAVKSWVRDHLRQLESSGNPEDFMQIVTDERTRWIKCRAIYPNVWQGDDGAGLRGEAYRIATILQVGKPFNDFLKEIETAAVEVNQQQAAQ